MSYVSSNLDIDGSGSLTDSEIANVTSIDVKNRSISSLKGIEFFTALVSLDCRGNQLTSLDVSNHNALTSLWCNRNQLTALDLSGCTALTVLECSNNRLTSLDMSSCTALTGLSCYGNPLTTLDLSSCTALTQLFAAGAPLTTLDVSSLTNLIVLDCTRSQLTTLDVSNNASLLELYCENNHLTTLDLSNNTSLSYSASASSLRCYSQDVSPLIITSSDNTSYPYQLDFSNYMSSDKFVNISGDILAYDSSSNDISTSYSNGIVMFASMPAKVKYNYATGHGSRTMDVTISGSNTAADVAINETNFPDATFRSIVKTNFDTNSDGVLSASEIANVTEISVSSMGISSLKGVEYFTVLTYLSCGGNQLTALDVSNNTALRELSCSGNQLTTLDVSNNTNLQYLDCNDSNLTALNLYSNTALVSLYCAHNQLTTLDVSNNTNLHVLHCHDNNLTVLNLSSNTALTEMYCDSQDASGFTVNRTEDTSYPYQLNFSSYISSSNLAKISDVQGLDSSGSNITTTYSNGIARFTAAPSKVTYNYNTGFSERLMDVTVTVRIEEPPIYDHDEKIRELLNRGLLDENYRPRITFGGDGSNFSGSFERGAVLTRTVSLGFSAQTWNVYINGQSVKVSAALFRSGVRVVEVADGITIEANEDGTSATITVNTAELENDSNNIQLGVTPVDGTEETALADLGTVVVLNPTRPVSEDVVEVAKITPVVLSDDVLQRIADSVNVDRSQIILLTSADFDPSEPPEPTEEMKDIARRDNASLVAKLNTIKVRDNGWYAFQVTVSDDLVGTAVSDLRIYAAEEEDFSAGSLRASFALLPLVNGVTGGFEIHNLLGIKLDTVPKQFLAVMFLSAGKSLTMYIGKILLMMLVGCSAAGGVGVLAVLGVFLIRRYRRRR